MKDSIKRVPIPLCGVMLGLAALGNLLQSYSEGIRYVCGIAAGLLLKNTFTAAIYTGR